MSYSAAAPVGIVASGSGVPGGGSSSVVLILHLAEIQGMVDFTHVIKSDFHYLLKSCKQFKLRF